ncbi:MAG: AMP-binding protein [Candidatus Omnitrophica bacterium]|nr:AMP-binding protein [Candidatus Omnitrophota bacterium]
MNTFAILQENAAKYGNKPALIFHDHIVTFADLPAKVFRLANALQKAGLQKGDRLGICLANGPEFVYAYLAGFICGAVVVPLDFMLKSDEISSCLTHSEAKIFIAADRPDLNLSVIRDTIPTLRETIVFNREKGAANPFQQCLDASFESPLKVEVNDTDPALIMYTSGTTGSPKGILLNYQHLKGSPEAMKYFVDLTDKDIKLAAIPFSHVAGFIYIQNCIIFGITLVIMDRFNPYEFLRLVQEHKVSCFHIVPAMYTALLSLKQIEKFDLSSLRWVVVFGAPSSPEIMERFHKYCPNAQLLNGWGMTETCPPNTVTPLGSRNIASVGKPSPLSEIKIVDEEDREVAVGKIGEILIRGWIVMKEYYKDPESTAQMKRNGWLYTGDIGRKDEEGFIYIVGRKKEMIKVAGQIVYAPEVESAFYKHESVLEAAVIGVADDMRGEVVKAFIVLKQGQHVSPEDLRYFAREHLANFKVPQTIEIRGQLPKNRTGKIDKEILKCERKSDAKYA